MNNAAKDGCLLEMIEPPLTIGRIDQCALMRSVHVGATLLEDDASLVRSIDVLSAKNGLPSSANAAFRNNQIVVAIALQELCALSYRSSIDGHAIIQ